MIFTDRTLQFNTQDNVITLVAEKWSYVAANNAYGTGLIYASGGWEVGYRPAILRIVVSAGYDDGAILTIVIGDAIGVNLGQASFRTPGPFPFSVDIPLIFAIDDISYVMIGTGGYVSTLTFEVLTGDVNVILTQNTGMLPLPVLQHLNINPAPIHTALSFPLSPAWLSWLNLVYKAISTLSGVQNNYNGVISVELGTIDAQASFTKIINADNLKFSSSSPAKVLINTGELINGVLFDGSVTADNTITIRASNITTAPVTLSTVIFMITILGQ